MLGGEGDVTPAKAVALLGSKNKFRMKNPSAGVKSLNEIIYQRWEALFDSPSGNESVSHESESMVACPSNSEDFEDDYPVSQWESSIQWQEDSEEDFSFSDGVLYPEGSRSENEEDENSDSDDDQDDDDTSLYDIEIKTIIILLCFQIISLLIFRI